MKSANELSSPAHSGNNFDFLRLLLASLVVLSHSYPLATGTEAEEPLAVLTDGQLTLGSFAVDGFFMISGLLISRSWLASPKVGRFLMKRVRRIYPGFLVAATLGAFVVAPLFSAGGAGVLTKEFEWSFVRNALRLIAVQPGPVFPDNPAPGTLNGALWSIPYEFWCYVLVLACGLRGWLGRQRLLWSALAVAIALSLIFAVTRIHPGGSYLGLIFGYPPFWARLLPYFFAGMAFGALGSRLPYSGRIALACAASLVIAARVPYGMIVVLPLAGAYLLFWFAQLHLPYLRGVAKHGDFSYGVYLYSFPILQMVMALHGGAWHPLALFATAWPLSLLAAAASWFLVERRFLSLRPAAIKSGASSSSAAIS